MSADLVLNLSPYSIDFSFPKLFEADAAHDQRSTPLFPIS